MVISLICRQCSIMQSTLVQWSLGNFSAISAESILNEYIQRFPQTYLSYTGDQPPMENQFATRGGMGALKQFLLHSSQLISWKKKKKNRLLAYGAVQKTVFTSPSEQRLVSWPCSREHPYTEKSIPHHPWSPPDAQKLVLCIYLQCGGKLA